MKSVIDAQYTRLCQELGHIEFQIANLQIQSQALKNKIINFNEIVPDLLKTAELRSPKNPNSPVPPPDVT